MAFEHSVVRVGDDGSDVGFLQVVAGDAGSAAAAALREWASTVHYGLWKVSDVRYGPGLWLTEVVTRTERYVAMFGDGSRPGCACDTPGQDGRGDAGGDTVAIVPP